MNFTPQGKFAYASGSKPLDGYTIKRGIGAGGFGEVYFALSDAGKEVALKRIQRNLDIELRGVKQCLNLKHLNLISLWDIRTNQAGESWVVMEYVPGPSLRDLIEAHPHGIPPEQVQVWFTSTASGVSYLHDQGIVHRDLKPANIFFDEDQQVIKIGDYGLSKFISCGRRSGQTETVGTFHYMAPEIGKGVYGKEIDIYALGILLFEMLTGDVPFNGESTQEIVMKHLTTDPDLQKLPADFRPALGRAMKKDPQHRFSNVSEMLDALPWPPRTRQVAPAVSRSDKERTDQLSGMLINDVDITLVKDGIAFGPMNEQAGESENRMIQFIETSKVAPADAMTVAGKPEPIAQAFKSGYSGITNWWYTAPLSTPLKLFILLLIGIVIVANSNWLLPMALALALVYLAYYGFRSLTVGSKAALEAPPDQASGKAVPRRLLKREAEKNRRFYYRRHLAKKLPGDRFTELIGSMLISAIACILFALLGINLDGTLSSKTLDVEVFAVYTWLSVSTIVGCWALLIAGQCWERDEGDPWLRRLTMAGIGLLVGLVSFLLASTLNIHTTTSIHELDTASPGPGLFNQLLMFTLLFAIVRWWKQTDPVRKTRLSIWSVGICLIWAVALSNLLGLDAFWNCMMALMISASTQLAAPWLQPTVRQQIALASLNETRVA
ncbi:MAG: serine/threonine protein kinase [Mariniblastus sp.]|nr:serine/threonine protein kinase [Mariniblastus sp.]